MDFGLDDEPTPEQMAEQKKIRERADAYLRAKRSALPRLTKAQAEILIGMLVKAYNAGRQEESMDACGRDGMMAQLAWEAAQDRSRKGVLARRRKSKRHAILAAFQAARGKDVSIEQLAKDHGVSRATAYRAINMVGEKTSRSKK